MAQFGDGAISKNENLDGANFNGVFKPQNFQRRNFSTVQIIGVDHDSDRISRYGRNG
ncbi:MAG: hypothetical protein ACFCBU_16710 [Cyanophyceae cyanobacterium]